MCKFIFKIESLGAPLDGAHRLLFIVAVPIEKHICSQICGYPSYSYFTEEYSRKLLDGVIVVPEPVEFFLDVFPPRSCSFLPRGASRYGLRAQTRPVHWITGSSLKLEIKSSTESVLSKTKQKKQLTGIKIFILQSFALNHQIIEFLQQSYL